MKKDELIIIRGDVVDKITHLDNTISIVIARYYFGKDNFEFINDVLYNRYVSAFAKQSILNKIFKRMEIPRAEIKDVQRLFEIRNIFAHSWAMMKEVSPDGMDSSTVNIYLREDLDSEYSAEELKAEFDEKFVKIQQFFFVKFMGADPDKEGLQTISDIPI